LRRAHHFRMWSGMVGTLRFAHLTPLSPWNFSPPAPLSARTEEQGLS
jgi:hypothetical protein